MDATPASISETGFDAALRALEDLETGVAQITEAPAPAPANSLAAGSVLTIASIGEIDFSDVEADVEAEADAAMAIAAASFTAIETPAREPSPPAQTASGLAPAAHPAPAVPAAPAPAPAGTGMFGKVAVGLALFTSMVSAAGLIVAERTIMSAQLVVADARERQHQLEQANKLIRDLEIVRDRQIELLQQQQLQLANAPVSSAELQHRMEALQAGLIQRDPVTKVVEAIRAGQADNTVRFNEFGMKMARVEAALGR